MTARTQAEERGFTERISIRLARLVILTGLLLGFVIAAIQVGSDFRSQDEALRDRVTQILEVAKRSATPAALRLDDTLATQVIDGLLSYPFIIEATLTTDLGTVLATDERPKGDSRTRFITELFKAPFPEFSTALAETGTPMVQYGQLTVIIDRDRSLEGFYDRALLVVLTGVARNLVLVLVLLAVFQIFLTRPLIRFVEEFRSIDPDSPGGAVVHVPEGHSRDELGLLGMTANTYVQNMRARLDELAATQAQLSESLEELTSRNIELERIAYATSHDLIEPARNAISFAQLLQRKYVGEGDDERGEYLEFIIANVHRINDQIMDLHAFSKVAGLAMDMAPVECDDACRSAIGTLEQAIQERGATIAAEPLPRVWGDRAQLTILFFKLIANGIKFHRQGVPPRVTVRAIEGTDHWRFEVSDNGIGVPANQAKNIFEPFIRLHAWHDHPGTGMGLAICRRIVDRHGGEIWVEPNPEGGSRFLFTLPCVKAPGEMATGSIVSGHPLP